MDTCLPIETLLGVVELLGFVLVSYGLLRESFAALAAPRPYGEGRFGEGAFGGGVGRLASLATAAGQFLRLLPSDRELTLVDRKRNAAAAVAGVLLVVLAMLVQLTPLLAYELCAA